MKPQKYIYPANKENFKNLIQFTKEIIKVCQENNIEPTIYGSFAHFYHTKDKEIKVNDIDLLVPKRSLSKITQVLEQEQYTVDFARKWNTMSVTRGKLRVEIDGIGFWYKDLNQSVIFKHPVDIDFYGLKTKLMTLDHLAKLYVIGYERTNDNKEKIREKIKHLEKYLGRKLK